MIEITEVPAANDVSTFFENYCQFVEKLSHGKIKPTMNTKNLKHFMVATSICKRFDINYGAFLAGLTKNHQKMEANKIVPPHQLSTQYAEDAAREVLQRACPPDSDLLPKIDATLSVDIPLEKDKRYQSAITGNNCNLDDCIYAVERQNILGIEISDELKERIEHLKASPTARLFEL